VALECLALAAHHTLKPKSYPQARQAHLCDGPRWQGLPRQRQVPGARS